MKCNRLNSVTLDVLETLKYDLFDISPCFSKKTNWSEVYDELVAQGVRGHSEKTLAYILENGILPQDANGALLSNTWKKKIDRQREIVMSVIEKQGKFVELLQKKGEKFVILKGFVSASLYNDYSSRRSGDVDFMVMPERFDAIHSYLIENGFECVSDIHPRHNEYTFEGVNFEMHKIFGYPDTPKSKGKSVDERFLENLNDPMTITVDGYSFPSLSISNIGICLLVHFAHHLLVEGIGFRQYLDWVMYADRYLSDEQWNGGFGTIAEEMGLASLAKVMTRTAQVYFGLSSEKRRWCSGVNERVCMDLVFYLSEKGNYGIKNSETKQFFTVMTTTNAKMSFFQTLQYRGKINWKALEKYPGLSPFAWCYQLCRYIKKTVQTQNPIGSYLNAYYQKKVFDRLKKECGLLYKPAE